MKKIFFIIFIFTISTHSFAKQQIDTVLKKFGDTVNIGILVQDQKTKKIIYQKNANHYFMPASNEKILTAAAALNYLGNNFTYKTQLFADVTQISHGILNGNIYLTFSGDPTLTLAQLDHLIHALSAAGIQQINGNIIVDDSAFDQMNMSPGTTWDDKDFCWGAPVNAIIIENNCVKGTLTLTTDPNKTINISLPEYPQSLNFINNIITTDNITDCPMKIKRTNTNDYTVSGCIEKKSLPKNIAMAINNPRDNIQFLLTYLLKKNQITSTLHFEFQKPTLLPSLLASEESAPTSTLVNTMLKESDNMIANSLFKTMGALSTKEMGSFQNGSDAVRNILNNFAKINIPTTTLIDGSGGSRYDFLTPQQIVTLLQKIYSSEQAATFITALPISGTDGTLKKRMQDPITLGKVSAKTGTATAVSTLSGYLKTKKKHTLVFSIMINGFVDEPTQYQKLEDTLCRTLIENN